jgi:AraC family transcriptional regulator
MNAQIEPDSAPTPHDMLRGKQRPDRLSTVDDTATKSSWPGNSTASEIDTLLEDIRIALDRDLGIATITARRLAALLKSKLPQGAQCAPVRGGLAPWQKRKIHSYIERRLEERIFIKDLAALVSLSVSHFSRAFKESFGQPAHAYIVRARVARARRLMTTTSESLSQIALTCGLLDQSHLCRTFRKATGVTPGAWRRSREVEPRSLTLTDRSHESSRACRRLQLLESGAMTNAARVK